jgi:hypothetical protein
MSKLQLLDIVAFGAIVPQGLKKRDPDWGSGLIIGKPRLRFTPKSHFVNIM